MFKKKQKKGPWVRALRDGEYPPGARRRKGDVFQLDDEKHMSMDKEIDDYTGKNHKAWMEKVEAPK